MSVIAAALAASARAESAQTWLTLFVGITILLTFVGAVARILYKVLQELGPDDEGHTVKDRLRNVEQALSNGIRSEIRMALDRVEQNAVEVLAAKDLAAEAARVATVADQKATDGRTKIERAVNSIAADLDVFMNVILRDNRRIKAEIRKLGGDLPDDE